MAQPRLYLFVTDNGLTAWAGDASRLRQTHAFTADADGHADFERFVQGQPHALYYLVLDLQEEDYRAETIPHVNARDRKRVLRRRLDQLYRESPYRSATPQGRETTGRRDDRVLLAALANPKVVDQWLDRLAAHDARIVGVYSITLLTARHARKIDAIPASALVITRQFGSGLRQTYIANGSLRFSRLTVPEADSEQPLAAQLAGEAARARQFLASLRAIERQEAMQVVMICSEAEQAALSAECPNSELIHYHFLNYEQVARSLGVSSAEMGATAEPLWLRHVAAYQPSNHYATSAQRKPYVAWQTGRALLAGAACFLLASIAAAAWYWHSARQLDADTQVQQQRQARADQIYGDNVPKVKEGELTPTGMKNVVLAYRQLVERWPQLEPSLQRVSEVLEQYPDAELDELSWQVSTDPSIQPAGFTDAGGGQAAAQPAQATDAGGSAPAPTNRYIVIGIRGQLPGYELRARQSLALVDDIAKAFAAQPKTTVTKLVLPIDVRPDKSISLGNEGNADAGMPFALKISYPLDPPATDAQPAQGGTP